MKYAHVTIITNKHFPKIEKHFRPTLHDLYDTRLCGYNTVWCHSSQCWSEAFFHFLNFCYYR